MSAANDNRGQQLKDKQGNPTLLDPLWEPKASKALEEQEKQISNAEKAGIKPNQLINRISERSTKGQTSKYGKGGRRRKTKRTRKTKRRHSRR